MILIWNSGKAVADQTRHHQVFGRQPFRLLAARPVARGRRSDPHRSWVKGPCRRQNRSLAVETRGQNCAEIFSAVAI